MAVFHLPSLWFQTSEEGSKFVTIPCTPTSKTQVQPSGNPQKFQNSTQPNPIQQGWIFCQFEACTISADSCFTEEVTEQWYMRSPTLFGQHQIRDTFFHQKFTMYKPAGYAHSHHSSIHPCIQVRQNSSSSSLSCLSSCLTGSSFGAFLTDIHNFFFYTKLN